MPEPSLSDALHRLMHAYKRQLRAGIQEHRIALPITQIRVLKCIGRFPESTARSIAQRMNQDKAQITRVLNELKESTLIEATENPDDRRSQFLTATKSGRRMLAKIDQLEEQAAAKMTRDLSAKQIQTFIRIAALMTQNSRDDPPSDKGSKSNG
ncbi:MarR family winged helix-turn-helix transcriptional regulator [Rhodopirellula sp. SWK7]|uniref:MarR family winged helix-turn-helix transcriptional regulator n=1 Tax=Rhodopirellula sp. SWK7 TaxID=595460 RepID=UPI0002BE7AB9|nr:MarR family winged helix-turn-helix transcriptional regulator [Rhodopirellula sp. SWK7]EMI42903.1 MarR family transcriptional regulator [Rhodopirellula sp. SWK7]